MAGRSTKEPKLAAPRTRLSLLEMSFYIFAQPTSSRAQLLRYCLDLKHLNSVPVPFLHLKMIKIKNKNPLTLFSLDCPQVVIRPEVKVEAQNGTLIRMTRVESVH